MGSESPAEESNLGSGEVVILFLNDGDGAWKKWTFPVNRHRANDWVTGTLGMFFYVLVDFDLESTRFMLEVPYVVGFLIQSLDQWVLDPGTLDVIGPLFEGLRDLL